MRNRDELTAWALSSELGFGIAGPLVACTGLGWWLDGQLGTDHWLVMIGLLIGLVSTVYTFYRLATAFPARRPATKSAAPRLDERDAADDNDND
jgi:F0F1-type ATP synthase assembly protein I